MLWFGGEGVKGDAGGMNLCPIPIPEMKKKSSK